MKLESIPLTPLVGNDIIVAASIIRSSATVSQRRILSALSDAQVVSLWQYAVAEANAISERNVRTGRPPIQYAHLWARKHFTGHLIFPAWIAMEDNAIAVLDDLIQIKQALLDEQSGVSDGVNDNAGGHTSSHLNHQSSRRMEDSATTIATPNVQFNYVHQPQCSHVPLPYNAPIVPVSQVSKTITPQESVPQGQGNSEVKAEVKRSITIDWWTQYKHVKRHHG